MKFLKRMAAFCAAAMLTGSAALAQEYDAQQAKSWMEQFAQALSQLAPVNDPAQTLDPARPGEYLQEYEFGTVQAATSGKPTAAQIEEIDVSTAQVTDARGIRVGMTLNEALNGLSIPQTEANLAVLNTQEAGVGWCWAYLGEGVVYGVEWLTYDLTEPVTEYTLTYVIDGDTVSGIRVKAAASTRAQAEAGLATAQEIADKQREHGGADGQRCGHVRRRGFNSERKPGAWRGSLCAGAGAWRAERGADASRRAADAFCCMTARRCSWGWMKRRARRSCSA